MRSFLLLCSVFFAKTITANLITIRNDIPRLDNTGTIMDAHDCTIRVLPNGTYVMHAIEYGLCLAPTGQGCDQTPDHCGFRSNHNITVWTSNDLTSGSWNYVGYAFPLESRPVSLIFRPDAIFNPHTNLWILYYNDAGRGNTYISSTSSSPFGPFTGFTTSNITDSTYSGGDFHLFIDENDNNQGYIIWTAMSSLPGQDHKIRISKLTNDFLGKTNDAPYVFNDNAPTTTFNEAPSIFKRGDTWYALFGHCCCFCEQGSGLFVHTAPTPLGPWTAAGATSPYDISCEAPPPPPPSNPFCAYKPEFNLVTVNLTCLNGGVINSVSKAFFGTPTGSCPDYSAGACDDPTFLPYAQATCVGQTTCVLESQGADPCLGTVKSIAVVATCSVAPGGYSPDGPVQPPSEAVQISVGGSPTPGQGCLYGGSTDISVTRSQQDFLATLPDGLGGFSYVYYGGRWGQSPDGIKGHEPQYVYPLQFNDDGSIQHITWNDTVSFNLAVAK